MSDLESLYGSANNKIQAGRTYVQIKKDAEKLEKDQKDNLEKDKNLTTTPLEQIKEEKKRFQKQMKTQMDHLLEMVQFNSGSGSGTVNYLKQKFIQAAVRVEPRIYEILIKESISALGCSSQQSYEVTQPIYIKVKSTDLLNLLKRDPKEDGAAVAYENTDPFYGQKPYSMNREMWYRLQKLNTPIDFVGASGQKLFSIKYIRSIPGGGPTGDFFEIRLANKVNNINTIYSFLVDYYRAIKLIDTSNIFQHLIDMICGAISIDAKIGTGEIELKNKAALILQRILGLCFDSKREIDISGTAKVAELDGIDDSFFEFTDIDLRFIDSTVSNIQRGVVEFEDCENIFLPVDSQNIISHLLKFNKATNVQDEEKIAEGIMSTLTDNEKWKILIPNSIDINLKADFSFLTNLPKAIMFAVLSPKVLLPLLIMSKAIGQVVVDGIDTILDFLKIFKKFSLNLMSKIGGFFVQELANLIKKDIKTLVKIIISDLAKEEATKRYALYVKLAAILALIVKFIIDWRKCKSVVQDILDILDLIMTGVNRSKVPTPLLAGAQFLGGYSSIRGFINVVEEFQKLGLPTGPAEDGGPNLALQAIFAQMKGQETEELNRKIQVLIPPLAITPAGLTVPASGFGVGI